MSKYKGILFIGDPHITAHRPSRRMDENFGLVSIDKLRQSLIIARERNLYPVILGDLFNRSNEARSWLFTFLYRVLREETPAGDPPPGCLAGNHDMKDTTLTDDTSLAMVAATGLLTVYSTTDPVVIEGLCVIHPVPNGLPLPSAVDRTGFADMDALPSIVITHDDFAFGDHPYPGAKPLAEIKGACMMVNGHMHKTERSIQIGETLCHNPGNILRMSVDTVDHVPSVWEWKPEYNNNLVGIALEYKQDVFDMIGKSITPDIASITQSSQFTQLLVAERASESARTEDGGMLSEDIQAIFEKKKGGFGCLEVADAVQHIINDMLAEAIHRNAIATAMPEEFDAQ